MKSKAIITRRGVASAEGVTGIQGTEAARLGLQVRQQLAQGTLVTGDPKKLAALEKQGYRVKLLADANILQMGAYRIDILENLPKVPAALEVPKALQKTWPHHVLQLAAPPSEDWIRVLEAMGVEVVDPMPPYGLFVQASPEQVATLRQLPFVEWAGPVKPAYRLSPNLQGRKGRLQYVHVSVYPVTALTEVKALVEAQGGKVISQEEQKAAFGASQGILLVEMNASDLPALVRLPATRWVEFQGADDLFDERSCQIVAENLTGAAAPNNAPVAGYQAAVLDPVTGLGLSGAGVTIGIVDSGVDTHNNATLQADLAGRMAFFVDASGGATTVDTNGHGTHVAGIAVGNAATGDTDPQGFLLGQGVAPGSQFGSVNPIGTGGPFMTDDTRVQSVVNNGGQVMNNSWGVTGGAGSGYTARSRTYDQRVRDPDSGAAGLEYLVIVSAAGNDGPNPGTIGAPWEAKNPIVVGNSLNSRPGEGDLDDIRGLRTSSSRGPAVDGRILPTIVAPGTDIIAARHATGTRPVYNDTGGNAHNAHTSMSGTSMAAPHVAGLCALLIEWWRNRTGGRNPSPALLKALLVNGAIDQAGGDTRRVDGAGNPVLIANIPNGDQGWGRVSLENMVLQAPDSDRGPKLFSDQRHAFTASGQEHTIRIAPVDTGRPLRITLAWTDAAAAAGANPALVNDLDLEVTEVATGTVFRGNVFANGFSTSGGAFDNRNNVECVYIQNPSGTYEVSVIAANVAASARPDLASPWQDFALVMDNAEAPAAAPVSVVPVIDRSGSMVSSGYVDITRISSKQFIDLMGIDDRLGVVSFGSTARVEYPPGAAPALQTIAGQPERDAAKSEIDGISFSGCTYMGAGINEARDLLMPATGRRAMVLLTDGYDNKGCQASNPARPSALDAVAGLPADMPVYTCAMGPASDQALLEQIAEATDGRYFYMPSIDDLFEIYNYIRGQITGEALVVNDSAMASSSRMAAFVDAQATEATFTVAWAEPRLRYVTGDPRKTNEISIRLRDPRGRLVHANDGYVRRLIGQGYVAFRLNDPMPGQWHVEVATARRTHTRYTVGGFVRSPLRLVIASRPLRVLAGAPLGIAAQMYDDQRQIAGFKASGLVRAPSLGIGRLLERYKTPLRGLRPQKMPGGDGLPTDIAQLMALRSAMLKTDKPDLFAHETHPLAMRAASQGELARFKLADSVSPAVVSGVPEAVFSRLSRPVSAMFGLAEPRVTSSARANPLPSTNSAATLVGHLEATRQPGSYNVVVTAQGTSPTTGTRYVRKELVSVLVR